MTERDKEEQVRRHLRGAARFERRKRNLARRAKDASADHGRRPEDDPALEEWEEEGTPRRGGRPVRRRRRRREEDEREPRPAGETMRAVVVGVTRGAARVRLAGEDVLVPIAGAALRLDGPLAVGDELELEPREGGPPRALALVPRRSLLARPDPANRHRALAVCANVDVGVVVVAAKDPPLRPALVDRYLVAFEAAGVGALVCVNKVDLVTEDERAALERLLAPYRALGIPVVLASAAAPGGTDALATSLGARTAVLVGHSGVGKSSLLNALAGEDRAAAGGVRAFDGKGRHTTTASALHELPGGARVIDTPGVRLFGLAGLERASLRETFPGLAPHAAGCRFADCLHAEEPECAVRAAAEAGRLAPERYAIYRRLLEDLET